jgi:DNA-directed RNA polymerase subunit L/DNA-directed RNA polymerase alpha subunit
MAEEKSIKKNQKINHITNIRYPYAKSWDKRNTHVEFELGNVHFSTSNAIRRLMISSIKTVGFRTEPYKACDIKVIVNDTPLHNQYISHRIAMVPINIAKPENFDVDDYLFIINVSNNTNSIMTITSEDFQIKQISTNKMFSKEEVKKFFPPDPITGDYIYLDRLRPKYFVPSNKVSKDVVSEMAKDFNKLNIGEDIMSFHIEGKASISTASENGHYSAIACASYINTVDENKALNGLKAYIDKQNETAKLKNVTPMTSEQLKNRFDLTERARFFHTNDKEEPNVFTFKIETLGIIPPLIIFHRAINILKDKIHTFLSNLIARNENVITIKSSEHLNGGYDLIVKDEDETLGNIIQSHLCILYADFTLPKEQRKLKYIGFKKPHPLEKYIIFSIQGQTDNIDEIINDIIKVGCSEIVKMLNKIQNELEGTGQFVNELKLIS